MMNRQGKLRGPAGAKAPSFVALDGTALPQNAKGGRSGGPGEAVPYPNHLWGSL